MNPLQELLQMANIFGNLLLEKAGEVLRAEFPELAERIKLRTPDEKDKRHGQAVAAASLPRLKAASA